MGAQVIVSRRGLLALGGGAALSIALPGRAATVPPPPAAETVDLAVSPARTTKMLVWRPAVVRGVALFSTGHGSWPERYGVLVALLAQHGLAVLAPVHVDSMHHPDRERFTTQQGFGERIADMAAASAFAGRAFAGRPVIAVGHSFGTLVSLCLGGGLADVAPFRNPAVKAVLGFSTPGRVPGLVQPNAYVTVAVPVMIVTGSADIVPGFVTDPADHRLPAESASGPAALLVAKDGGHDLVAGTAPAWGRIAPAAALFVDGYGLGEARAAARLAHWRAEPGDRFQFRKGRA